MVAMLAITRQFCLVDTQRERCTGTHTFRWRYSKDARGSGGSDCIWVDHIEWTPPSQGGGNNLDEYVDSLLTYTTGGDADWQGDLTTYFYDQDSARNGDIEDSEESWMQTTVEDGGTFSFYWKVSSESGYDWLDFYIDAVRQARISGSTNWDLRGDSHPFLRLTRAGPGR